MASASASAIATTTSGSDETNSSADTPPQVKGDSLTAIHSGAEPDDDEEEDLCRICRCAATSEDPLHYPCACRGSIKFVHQNCLLQWINHSNSRRCEVCRHTFSFTPIYAEKTPTRLSLAEQLTWLAAKTWTASKFFTRLALVLFVWFVIVPFLTAHFWDISFIKTPRELRDVHWLHRNSNTTIFYEILCGQLIFLCTMVLAVALLICSEELFGANRIPLLGDRALFEENESFTEIIGMRGPAFKLIKRAFQVQLAIAFFLVIAVLVPFSWGRIILYQLNSGTRHASDWCMLAVGYISILGPAAIIAGLYMIRRFSKDITLTRSSIMNGLCACRSFVVRVVRQGFILMVVFGTFPCLCGWWFDICTMKMMQMQFGGLDHLLDFPPLRILVFWGCGIITLVVMKKFLLLIDEELQLREGILYSLQIPRNINQISIREFTDASIHDNAYRLLLNAAVFMTLTVVLVFLPFKLVNYTLPSFFPLNFILCYSPSGLHWNTLGRLLRSRYVSRHYNPHSASKFLLHHWLSFVAKALHLDDLLLPMNGDANGNASTSRFDEVKESQDDQVDSNRLELVVKIAALLILGSLSLVLLTSATIIVPISLGRAVFSLIMWISTFNIGSNDEINFLIGCYIISDGIVAVRSFINFVGTRRILSVVQLAGKWCMIGLKCFALLTISVLFIPLQLGLLANLMIEMPLDVSVDERPVFYLHHIWVSGCILLSAWIRLVMSGVRDTNSVEWRAKFERVKADGFSHLRALWVVREILCPIVFNLLTWLCVPYIFAKGVFPLLGFSMRTNSSVYHFAWLAYLVLSLLYYIVKRLYMYLASLHDRIKDDRYLIGTTLCNFQQEDATH